MTYYKIIYVLMLFVFVACGDSKKNSETDSTSTEESTTPPQATYTVMNGEEGVQVTPPATAPSAEPPQNAAGVWHYTCPKGCSGGAGAASPCANCGATLAHNAAYHGDPGAGANATTATPPPPPTAEPPQNAKGVWHFTCPKGCSGGAGTTSPCAQCGTTLAHNQVYHQ